MKRLIFAVCFFMALVSVIQAEEFRKCIDKNGNVILTNTDNPVPDVKCESTGIESMKPAQNKPDETNNVKQRDAKKQDESGNEEAVRKSIQSCIACCNGKKSVFLNMNSDLRIAEALFQDCTANCQSEGKYSSEWSDCWVQPEPSTENPLKSM